jgi:hypothetical protein
VFSHYARQRLKGVVSKEKLLLPAQPLGSLYPWQETSCSLESPLGYAECRQLGKYVASEPLLKVRFHLANGLPCGDESVDL